VYTEVKGGVMLVKFKDDLVCPCPNGSQKAWDYLRGKQVEIGHPVPQWVIDKWHEQYGDCPSDTFWEVKTVPLIIGVLEVYGTTIGPGTIMHVCRCVLDIGD
jgi:hypothetical protein